MSPGKILKVAWRARSVAFALDCAAGTGTTPQKRSFLWRGGDGAPVAYRRGTSDAGLIYDLLLKPGPKGEYWLPEGLEARTVLDIGANVGIASRYLARRFPQARVHAFEPVPENAALLRENAAHCDRIVVHAFALGPQDGEVRLASPDPTGYNRGGYSAFAAAASGALLAPVKRVERALAEAGIASVDVIKIDTEGAELAILSAFPEPILSRVQWIYGELHRGSIAEPADFRTLDFLSRWFDVAFTKPIRKRTWFFDACRRDLAARFRDFRRYR